MRFSSPAGLKFVHNRGDICVRLNCSQVEIRSFRKSFPENLYWKSFTEEFLHSCRYIVDFHCLDFT